MSTTSTPPTDTIRLLADRGLGRLVFAAIAETSKQHANFDQIARAHRANEKTGLKVVCTVAGVPISLDAAITRLFEIRAEEINRLASERALELVSAAGLNGITETLREADWQIKAALRKVGAEFSEDR